MVSISEKDRDALRFLWVDDVHKSDPELQVFRFARVVFGVSSSPFLLNDTIDHHLKKFTTTEPELVDTLVNSIYVDDILTGAPNEEAALQLYRKSKDILRLGGFNLRKFTTNVQEVQESIDRSEARQGEIVLPGSFNPQNQKVLGVNWDITNDRLVFSVSEITCPLNIEEVSKRKVVSIIGKSTTHLAFYRL